MNKMAQRVLPVMNEAELEALIDDHYVGEAQTLAADAEPGAVRAPAIDHVRGLEVAAVGVLDPRRVPVASRRRRGRARRDRVGRRRDLDPLVDVAGPDVDREVAPQHAAGQVRAAREAESARHLAAVGDHRGGDVGPAGRDDTGGATAERGEGGETDGERRGAQHGPGKSNSRTTARPSVHAPLRGRPPRPAAARRPV